ncbi:MAG: zinc metalloprotease HtpX [Euryarchaeota archaeon]|nr:zinc metalloprotease HtpX [Euryarchaeota archaeon]
MFAIVYALVAILAQIIGISGFLFYGVLASVILLIQYMIGPKLVDWSMGVKYVSEQEYPELHRIVEDLSRSAKIPKPKVGVARIPIPNAFAFGRWASDARVCVTDKILNLLTNDELKAVLGHEISHLKHRDMVVITMLSVVPTICWYIFYSTLFARGERRGNIALIGILAFVAYFITNLLVLYGSRIREYYADLGSVRLGNEPHYLATALYKLVYGSAKASKDSLKQVEGLKAFFVNDPSRARTEIQELRQIDLDMSGTIDKSELMALSTKSVRVGTADKIMEIFSTHPNMVKRIKHLSTLIYHH